MNNTVLYMTARNGKLHKDICGHRGFHVYKQFDVHGMTEQELVSTFGTTLCRFCHPDAPADTVAEIPDVSQCPGAGTGDYSAVTKKLDRHMRARYYGTCNHCGKKARLVGRDGLIGKHRA